MTPTEEAAKLAVEEMAETILYRLEDRMKRLSGEDDYLQIIKAVIAPLYAKLADMEQRLERNREFVIDQSAEITRLQSNLDFCQAELEERIQIMHKPKESEKVDYGQAEIEQ